MDRRLVHRRRLHGVELSGRLRPSGARKGSSRRSGWPESCSQPTGPQAFRPPSRMN